MSSSLAFTPPESHHPKVIDQALLDALARLPENVVGELVAGEIHVSPAEARGHGTDRLSLTLHERSLAATISEM